MPDLYSGNTLIPEPQTLVQPECVSACRKLAKTLVTGALMEAVENPGVQEVIVCTGRSFLGCRGTVEAHEAGQDPIVPSRREEAAAARGAGQIPLSHLLPLIEKG